ncbi:MAG: RES family NAD+ phosphorylase [Gammaproteobacteria bacterium]
MHLAHGNLDDQTLLEDILEAAKPPLPPDVAGLHWLLATPFRYRPDSAGSRFRARHAPGVFYGAETRETACAETGWWRLKFWLDSAGLAERRAHMELTLFEFHAAHPRHLDLRVTPFVAVRERWTATDDYTATQALAAAARTVEIGLIRYESARHPGGVCLAILEPAAFRGVARAFRHVQQTWTLMLLPPSTVVWQRHLGDERWAFRYEGGIAVLGD